MARLVLAMRQAGAYQAWKDEDDEDWLGRPVIRHPSPKARKTRDKDYSVLDDLEQSIHGACCWCSKCTTSVDWLLLSLICVLTLLAAAFGVAAFTSAPLHGWASSWPLLAAQWALDATVVALVACLVVKKCGCCSTRETAEARRRRWIDSNNMEEFIDIDV